MELCHRRTCQKNGKFIYVISLVSW